MPTGSGASADLSGLNNLLNDLTHALDFDSPGDGGTFAVELANLVGGRILDRTLGRGQGADGKPLPENRGEYARRKQAKGLPVGVGLGDGQPKMLEIAQAVGQVTVAGGEMTQEFGTAESAKDKAGWFTRGNDARNQPARPFYEVDDDDVAAIQDLCQEKVVRVIRG